MKEARRLNTVRGYHGLTQRVIIYSPFLLEAAGFNDVSRFHFGDNTR